MKRSLALVLCAAAALFCARGGFAQGAPQGVPTGGPVGAPTAQPATPVPASAIPTPAVPTAMPAPTPPAKGKHAKVKASPGPSGSPKPTPSPPPPAFLTLDGYWELVEQTPSDNIYSNMRLKQNGAVIVGTWKEGKTEYPIEGTYDGRLFKFTVKHGSGEWTMAGYVENSSDMVGMITAEANKQIVFTASHRAKYKGELLITPSR